MKVFAVVWLTILIAALSAQAAFAGGTVGAAGVICRGIYLNGEDCLRAQAETEGTIENEDDSSLKRDDPAQDADTIEKVGEGENNGSEDGADIDRGNDYDADKGSEGNTKERKEQVKSKEYIAFIFGYGAFIPVAHYGERYYSGHLISGTIPVYWLNLWGISPEIHTRYVKMESRPDKLKYGSTLTLVQIFPALVYRYNYTLPYSFKGPLTPYVRIYDGITRVDYRSNDPLQLYGPTEVVEYINVFGVSAGLNLTLYDGLFIGIDVCYSIIATAGKPLQSVSVMMNTGYKIF